MNTRRKYTIWLIVVGLVFLACTAPGAENNNGSTPPSGPPGEGNGPPEGDGDQPSMDQGDQTTDPFSSPQPTYTMLPTYTGMPTYTAMPTFTSVPTNTSVPTSTTICDLAGFVSDVTIPDGTDFNPGVAFTKTWRLKNLGACTWTSGYQLIFDHGDQMGGPSTKQLTSGTVPPGANVDVSVNLVAPNTPGSYQGYWKIRNPQGYIFGLSGNNPFYVKIDVVPPTPTPTPAFPIFPVTLLPPPIILKPDLVILSIEFSPVQPTVGQNVRVYVRIKNNGLVNITSSISVFWFPTETSHAPGCTISYNGLNAGATKTKMCTYFGGYSTSYPHGVNTLAIVDFADAIDEFNETNNRRYQLIAIMP